MSGLLVRASTEADVTRCAEIYAHHVLHGTASFEVDPPDLAEMNIGITHQELAARVAHGGTAIAAAPGLVEHQRAMLGLEGVDQAQGRLGGKDALDHVCPLEKAKDGTTDSTDSTADHQPDLPLFFCVNL